MTRLRAFVLVTAAVMLVAGCSGGTGGGKAGGQSEPVVLTMASRYGSIEWVPGAAYFVKRVAELSGGALRIDVADGWGSGQPDVEQVIVRDVAEGKADLGWVGTRVFDTLGVKSFQALTGPMLVESYPLLQAVLASDLPSKMLKSLDGLGVAGLAVLGDSLRKPVAMRGPILGRADWSGIVFETNRSLAQAESIQALGAGTTDILGDVLGQALKEGTVQGYDLGMFVYVTLDLEGIPYVTANVNLWPQTLVLMANPQSLSTLTDQQRAWIQRAASDAAGRSTSLVDRDAENFVIACRNGARLVNASETDLAWLRKSFAPVYADLERDPQTKSFIQSIEALKRSMPAEPTPDIPAGCTGPVTHGADDPIAGTWVTDKLTEPETVQAFIAAGGSEKDGHAFFSQLGGGSTSYAVITLQFQDGIFKEFESGDGKSSVQGATGNYEIGPDNTFTSGGCPGAVDRFEVNGDTLRLYVVVPCTGADAVYGVTLFASFPFRRTG